MAEKRKPAKAKNTGKSAVTTKVTRISASDDAPVLTEKPAKKQAVTKTPVIKPKKVKKESSRRTPWRAIADYFGGAWYEIRQVSWPSRAATWKLTLALIAYTAFFVVAILILDWVFQSLFNKLLS